MINPEIARKLSKKRKNAAHLNVASADVAGNFRIVAGFAGMTPDE